MIPLRMIYALSSRYLFNKYIYIYTHSVYLPSLYISVLYTSPGPHFLIPLFDLSHQLFTHPIQVKILLDSGLLALQFLPQGDGHDPHPRRSERFLLKSFDSRIPMGGTGKNLPETKKNNIFPIPKYF